MTQQHILFVLANDAQRGSNGQYLDIGQATKARIDEAVREYYVQMSPRCTNTYFAFGAGNAPNVKKGPTIAALCEGYLRTIAPTMCGTAVIANHEDRKYWGTLEELSWLVRTLRHQFPRDDCRVHIFASAWHLWRAKVALYLFFPYGTYHLHPVNDGSRYKLWHEFLGLGRLAYIKWFGGSSRCGHL